MLKKYLDFAEMAGALIPLNRLRSSSKNKLDYSGTKVKLLFVYQVNW